MARIELEEMFTMASGPYLPYLNQMVVDLHPCIQEVEELLLATAVLFQRIVWDGAKEISWLSKSTNDQNSLRADLRCLTLCSKSSHPLHKFPGQFSDFIIVWMD